MAAATVEDFSFPTFTDTGSSAIDSPPLWRLSPAASPDSCHNRTTTTATKKQENQESDQEGYFHDEETDEEEDFKDCFPIHKPIRDSTQRKSFSWVEEKVNNYDEYDDEDQEKMDMLWEDFNEDLPLKRSHSSSKISDSDMVHMGCVQFHQSLRLSKNSNSTTNTAMVSAARKPAVAGLVVFMKVLKKFFLLHNSHSHKSVHNQNHHSHIGRRVKNRSW